MRYIDTSDLLSKKDTWGTPKDRWRDEKLRMDFLEYRSRKCWYSESLIDGDDAAIDHFRPKSAVKPYKRYEYNQELEQVGYHWLGNDVSNYRVSCTYCNELRKDEADRSKTEGKSCFFPLVSGSPHLTENGKEIELPMLLDPCKKEDVNLLTFHDSEAAPMSKDCIEAERATVSIELYHLNHKGFIRGRIHVLEGIKQLIKSYDSKKLTEEGLIENLNGLIGYDKPYSATAIAYIKKALVTKQFLLDQLDLEL